MTDKSTPAYQRLAMPQLTPRQTALRAKLYAGEIVTSFPCCGEDWTCRLLSRPRTCGCQARIEAEWGDCGLTLSFDRPLPLDRFSEKLNAINPSTIPKELFGAAYEVLLEEDLDALERAFGQPITITGMTFGEDCEHMPDNALPFTLTRERDGYAICGALEFRGESETLIQALEQAFPQTTHPAHPADRMGELPVQLSLEIGETRLLLRDLLAIQPHDIIVVDTYHYAQNQSILLRTKKGPVLRGTLDNNTITIEGQIMDSDLHKHTSPTENSAANTAADSPAHAEPGKAVDLTSIEVPLHLELETRTITVRELADIQPGFVIQTTKSVDAPIELSVNGKTIGTGELVDIAGTVGVRVLTIGAKDTGE